MIRNAILVKEVTGAGNISLNQDLEGSLEVRVSDNLVPPLEKTLNDLSDWGGRDVSAELGCTERILGWCGN